MRTTINIEDDILRISKSLAEQRGVSLGKVISDMLRAGLQRSTPHVYDDGLPVFTVMKTSQIITLEDVKKDEDEP